ncbi:MAG: hypothetical protein AB8B50_03905 [Pirellulaceae bacterium]
MSLNKPWKNREYASLGTTSAAYVALSAMLPSEGALYAIALAGRVLYQQHRIKEGFAFWDTDERLIVSQLIGLTENSFRQWAIDDRGCRPLGTGAYVSLQDLLGWPPNFCEVAPMLEAAMTRQVPVWLHKQSAGKLPRRHELISPIEAAMMYWLWLDSSGRPDLLQAIECFPRPCDVPETTQERIGDIAIDACFEMVDKTDRELFGGVPATSSEAYGQIAMLWQRMGLAWVVGFDGLEESGFLNASTASRILTPRA